jgi:hypothetical protein
MLQSNTVTTKRLCLLTLLWASTCGIASLEAQPGPTVSVTYDALPYQEFKESIVESADGNDTTFLDNAQVQLQKLKATLTYPIVFSKGRTVLVNDLSYQLILFKYRGIETPLKRLHAASYTLMLQHRLSRKWSVWALATPSLASDLEAEVSENDFNLQAATIFIRHFSERLSIGLGAAYSTQFGSAIPLPILAFDWNNGKNLMAKAVVPVSFEFWYRPGSKLDLGLVMSGDGNNFRGDPAIYQVTNPELRYTMMTIGPVAKITLFDGLKLHMEGGVIALHRFEFFDGDNEDASYDLKPSQHLRVGLQYGG